MAGCARPQQAPAHIPQASDSLYTAQAQAYLAYAYSANINNLRMLDALRLLQEDTEISLSDIAETGGFTPANFREQFKRQFGMTPTEYRQNL